jgi:hypothetical protein
MVFLSRLAGVVPTNGISVEPDSARKIMQIINVPGLLEEIYRLEEADFTGAFGHLLQKMQQYLEVLGTPAAQASDDSIAGVWKMFDRKYEDLVKDIEKTQQAFLRRGGVRDPGRDAFAMKLEGFRQMFDRVVTQVLTPTELVANKYGLTKSALPQFGENESKGLQHWIKLVMQNEEFDFGIGRQISAMEFIVFAPIAMQRLFLSYLAHFDNIYSKHKNSQFYAKAKALVTESSDDISGLVRVLDPMKFFTEIAIYLSDDRNRTDFEAFLDQIGIDKLLLRLKQLLAKADLVKAQT